MATFIFLLVIKNDIIVIVGEYMKRIINLLKSKELKNGYLYFYIHFVLEITCFFYISRITNNSIYIWIVPFIYDALAFVPQGLIGYFVDKHPKINIGLIGVIFLIVSYLIYSLTNISVYVSLVILCIGNAIIHVAGAEDTIRTSNGKLSTPAIFVSGGAFGIITGRVLSRSNVSPLFILLPIISMIPMMILSKSNVKEKSNLDKYDYVKKDLNKSLVILIALFVVTARGYTSYGIPLSWNKTAVQTVIFFFVMGFGKALGGLLSDLIGIRKTTILSTLLSIPFLCFGDRIMIVSLIGVMLFSMTMSITLGILVSSLKKYPGVAFGITTVGLFFGTLPIFFIKFSMITNIIIMVTMSIVCSLSLLYVLKGEK